MLLYLYLYFETLDWSEQQLTLFKLDDVEAMTFF